MGQFDLGAGLLGADWNGIGVGGPELVEAKSFWTGTGNGQERQWAICGSFFLLQTIGRGQHDEDGQCMNGFGGVVTKVGDNDMAFVFVIFLVCLFVCVCVCVICYLDSFAATSQPTVPI